MKKEQRWALRYVALNGQEMVCYPRSEQKKEEQIRLCHDRGIKVISCQKLYPFSTVKNQHNFDLINSLCANALYDMMSGEADYNSAEFDRLSEIKELAERFFCLELPVAWLTWDDWQKANELAAMAVLHRQEACIANGRPDLVTYC